MATNQMSEVIQHLRRTVLVREGAGLTDGQLLEDYLSRRDEAALAALVHRHGPMVWGVCRRVLRNYHDAEDAFQATFLVLVRKAASIVPRAMVANWLYGVAHQTALNARATAARRKGRERQVAEMPEPAVAEQDLWRDLQPLLDEELSRLPDKYRVVIVLCDLEGKTRKETARQLDVPEGTVAGRLARARTMLAKRLAQKGVALSGGALAVVLSQKVASAGVPTSVVSSTIKVASLFAAGQAAATGAISAKVAALTEGVVKTMFVTKIKTVMAVVLVVGLTLGGIGAGVGFSTNPVAVAQQPGASSDDAEKPGDKEKPKLGDNKNMAFRRVRLVELDAKASVMTADVVSDRANDTAKATGIKPHTVRLMNLPIATNATITDGKKNLKLSDLKVGSVLLLLLVGEGDAAVVNAIQVEDGTEQKTEKGKAKDTKVWTIEEALTQLPTKTITVEFEVGKAGKVWATGATLGAAFNKQKDADEPFYLYPAGLPAGKFYVTIYNLNEARLKALGLSKADNFVGKRVRVTGQVDVTSRPARPNTTGRIIVWEPEREIEVVK
jgi:RNA polymerase sigma factor (sigma-70 family)